MAEGKQVPLSIVLRTVDKATAGINAVNKRLDALTKPTRDFGKALSDLAEKSGMNRVSDAFGRVGSAATEVIGKVAMIGGALAGFVGGAVAGMLHLVDQFSELGHVARRAGVEVDFLAGIRYAGEKAGLSIQQVDEGITALTQNIGQAKSGTGRMFKFLEERVGHVFAQQVIHTNSTAEAIGILADAMHKLPDAARRAALAQKTLGDPAFVQLLMQGSGAIQAQMAAYAKLAPSMEGAVAASHEAKEAMHDLDAAADGVKAVLVTGLAPALGGVIQKMTAWLVGHRADIAQWAEDIGKKLPGAVENIVAWIGRAYGKATSFIDKIGGLQTVALALAASITGPLIASIASLGIAMMSSPAGLVLAGLGALALGIAHVATHDDEPGEEQASTASETGGAGTDAGRAFLDEEKRIAQQEARDRLDAQIARLNAQRRIDEAVNRPPVEGFGPALVTGPSTAPATAQITIDITGAPKGTRATIHPSSTANVDLSVGHQMGVGQ